ncbi:MAG: hypothetical protein ACE5HF_09820 [Gemmatimonadota bacterium]
MLRKVLALALAGLIALPVGALAQEDEDEEVANPTLVLTNFQCDWAGVGEIVAELDSISKPVYQALVDEGKLLSWGTYIHAWADEYNVNFYSVATDIPSFLAAWQEGNERIAASVGEEFESALNRYCGGHKDAFYVLGPRTSDEDDD